MADRQTAAARRITLILHKFSQGGSDRVSTYLARGFADAGLDVELLVICRGGEVESLLVDLLGADIPVRYLSRTKGPRSIDLVRNLPRLVRALRARHPDVILSTANNTALISAFAMNLARLPGCRLVLKTTNPIASSRHRGFMRKLRLGSYRWIFRWTSAVWTLSAQESEEMRAAFPGFARLFHDVANPYVTPAMLSCAQGAAPTRSGKLVVSIARLTAQKRIDRLIRGFAEVMHPGARLLILGEGEEREALSQLISGLDLEDRVSMPGYVQDVVPALRSADLFVLTSDYEGLPAALLEAMAADCPVLTTDCFPAARALIDEAPGCGIIDRVDPVGLGTTIDEYLARPRPSALRAIAERYSIANAVDSHLEALADACSNDARSVRGGSPRLP
jgi:glycosyltransferase involved in cell wall biosynthesis